jgi:hypothetical protein
MPNIVIALERRVDNGGERTSIIGEDGSPPTGAFEGPGHDGELRIVEREKRGEIGEVAIGPIDIPTSLYSLVKGDLAIGNVLGALEEVFVEFPRGGVGGDVGDTEGLEELGFEGFGDDVGAGAGALEEGDVGVVVGGDVLGVFFVEGGEIVDGAVGAEGGDDAGGFQGDGKGEVGRGGGGGLGEGGEGEEGGDESEEE